MGEVQRVAGYARVSTEEQARGGVSLDVQCERLRACAAWRFPGAEVDIFQDVGSGRKDSRPGFRSLRNAITHGQVLAVMVLDLDRLARSSMSGWAFLRECDARDVVVVVGAQSIDSSTPAGRHFLRSLLSAAEYESDMISERVQRSVDWNRAHGRKGPGLRPFGWQVTAEGGLVPDPREGSAIQMSLAMRAQGQSWGVIAAALRDSGISTVSGSAWTAEGARSVLVRAAGAAAGSQDKRAGLPAAQSKTIAPSLQGRPPRRRASTWQPEGLP